MSHQKITQALVQRIQRQFVAEENVLKEIPIVLRRLNQFDSTSHFFSDSLEGKTTLDHLLEHIQNLSQSREQLRLDIAQCIMRSPRNVTLEETLKAFEKDQSSETPQLKKDLCSLRNKIAQTSGKLKATIRNLITKKYLADLSLSALGMNQQQDRYNSSGAKI